MEPRRNMPALGWSALGGEPRRKIIVILGPTASGKSDVAIRLAREFNGEIISADSRQVYRGMDLGTGKVTKKEQALAKHWMLDIVSPNTKYNAAKFQKQADKIIRDILKRKKLPIICGGTGFWIKTLVDGVVFPKVKPDEVLRNKLRNKTADRLFAMLKKMDPVRAKSIDAKNKVRLIRAIEICKELGSVPNLSSSSSPYQGEEKGKKKYAFIQIGIAAPKHKLHQNIKARLEKRLKQGMIREVKDLHFKQKVSWKRLESFGLEYRWIALYLQNKISEEEMAKKLYFDIIHYAKRQMTWFKKDSRIKWMKNYSAIQNEIKNFIKK